MRKKIEISKEEKEFIDKMNLDFGRNAFINYMNIRDREGTPLNDLAMSDVSLIFNGWYEVKEKYEAGDYVYNTLDDCFYRVTDVSDDLSVSLVPLDLEISITLTADKNSFVKVKDKWKIELLNMGRTRPMLKEGDVLISDSDSIWINEDDESEDKMYKRLEGDNAIRLYPVETSIKLK